MLPNSGLNNSNAEKKRLLFFHHAGGSANQYLNLLKPWQNQFEIWALDLPGRGFRLHEKPIVEFRELLDQITKEVLSLPLRKTWIMGHSMGALLAMSLGFRLETDQPNQKPQDLTRIGLSAFRPPNLKNLANRQNLSFLPDDQFAQALEKISPWPEIAKLNLQTQNLFLQVARNDFQLIESYQNETHGLRLLTETLIYGGELDLEAPPESLKDWQNFIQSPLQLKIYSGGHFFIFEHFNQIVSYFLKDSLSS